jgi:exopolysaccharide/PEP-CTERM locus tyrosine autokinase
MDGIVSTIEQAAKRLEQLLGSGVVLPPIEPIRPREATVPRTVAPQQPAVPTGAVSRRVELDEAHLLRSGLILPHAPKTRLADEFRSIKRPLLTNARDQGAAPVKRGNCIMVTSALEGEGKTFVSCNLAMSIAGELDHRVVLVDADVLRPTVLHRFGLPPSAGLLDLLTDKAIQMSDVLLRTSIDKLSILPAGTPRHNADELLASESMRKLIEEMSERYPDRIVVFDAPPLLLSNEARVLASQVGQVVVVVAAEQTRQSVLLDALASIDACPVVMTLLNRARGSAQETRFGYYG